MLPTVSSQRRFVRSATGRRIAAAFAAILALFAVALAVILTGMGRIADAEHQVARLDHAKHAGHQAASMAREQYIHQAHTLIEWNDSHVGHYAEVVDQARAATEHLRAMVDTSETRRQAEEIARLVADSHRLFETEVVPAVRSDDRSRIGDLHRRTEHIVQEVVGLNEELNTHLERRAATARTAADDARASARALVLGCFGLAILLASGVGLYLMRSISRPVAALRQGAVRVGAGDLGAEIHVTGRDEFAELAGVFNQMTRDLARHQAETLEAHRLASIGQVASGVAHEINNPLGVILGYIKLLRADPTLAGRDELEIIDDEVRQCQRIVTGLLDLARPLRLSFAGVDLAELARDAVERLDESGQSEGVRIALADAPTSVVVRGDEARLRQVVVNLLINAVDAAGDPNATAREVHVTWRRDGGRGVLEVVDRGPGIPPDVLPRVFDPFFSTKARGHGLGLAIARTIARAHQGDVEVGTSIAGNGARVALWIPVDDDHPKDQA
jgi:two-component system NtrC family sensor kinase